MPKPEVYYAAATAVLDRGASVAPELQEFLTQCGDGRLRFQYCLRCSAVRFLSSPVCPECLSEEFEWRIDPGAATIWSFCVYHRGFAPEFREITPYAVCLVELDSGPRLITNPVDISLGELRIGQRGRVVPVPVGDDIALPYFFADGHDG